MYYTTQTINDCRSLSLEKIAIILGLIQDKHDKKKWRSDNAIISIDSINNLFFDHLHQKGGKGAIDLTIHVLDCDFKQAIAYLGGTKVIPFSPAKDSKLKIKSNKYFQKCNILDPNCWHSVFDYLQKRGLPAKFLKYMYENKYIAADCRRNAVFFRYSINPHNFARIEPLGASLRSTSSNLKLLTSGTKRSKCWFFFRTHKVITQIFLTESPIDAMSLATIHHFLGTGGLYISVDGCGSLPLDAIESAIASNVPVFTAFDNDRAGKQMSQDFTGQFSAARNIYPPIGKDWNDCLLAWSNSNRQSSNNN